MVASLATMVTSALTAPRMRRSSPPSELLYARIVWK
jgi:hypothetical protein